ncbi:hypothetical protein FB451DRAFT_1563197 [Mycena latifolia]|nr:hypothetical protein FB451DRAFT_1563197 [Mycena latifolia]
MAGVAPPGSIPVSQTPGDQAAASQQLSWEGDKMFNIYIYDYCYKRGFRKTARELLLEADIPSDSTPPINARQGLLFEWWSVFWVLFTAKANGNGTDDAMLYTQHQAHQTAMKQNQNRPPPPQPMPMPPSQMQPIGRGGVNGIAVGGQRFAPNGVIPNGIPPGNGQPPGPTAFVGGPMQPNGIMPGPPAPPGMGPQFMPQRPPTMGGPPRAPNGGPPFQSPTMAHSPPNPGQQSQPPQQHPPPPMGQLGPPQRGMLPPGQQGMNMGQQGMPGQQTPTPSYQNLAGRPPSRTSTPQGMMNPSPSMAPRQPMMPGGDPRQEMNSNNELQAIPLQVVNMLKADLGMGDKNIHSLTLQDKQRILSLHKQRAQKAGQPPNNAAAGPSMQPPRRNNKRNSTSPGEDPQQPDDGRNGSSPPDRKRIRRSPMDQQIPGAPMNYAQHPNQPPQPQPGGPGGPQQQAMGNGGMMRPMSGPMNGGFPQQGQPNMQQQMSGSMGMLGNMNPMMSNAMPNTMSPQMHPQPTMYRQGMHNLQHPNRMGMNAGSPGSDPSFNPGGVPMPPGPGGPGQQQQQQPGGQQQFAPGSRLSGPPNAKPMSMLPPPSPAKDQNAQNKDNKGPSNGHPEGSPRNQPLSGPNPPGTAPPTPGGPNQGQGQPGQNQNMASPGMLMNPGTSSMNPAAMPLPPPAPPSDTLFSAEFIQSVATGLDEFDVGLFRGDGDINFERDFGQWFNPDDVGSMELGKQ